MERYDLILLRNYEQAQLRLRELLDTNEVNWDDKPRIEPRETHSQGRWFAISLLGYERPNCKF